MRFLDLQPPCYNSIPSCSPADNESPTPVSEESPDSLPEEVPAPMPEEQDPVASVTASVVVPAPDQSSSTTRPESSSPPSGSETYSRCMARMNGKFD